MSLCGHSYSVLFRVSQSEAESLEIRVRINCIGIPPEVSP